MWEPLFWYFATSLEKHPYALTFLALNEAVFTDDFGHRSDDRQRWLEPLARDSPFSELVVKVAFDRGRRFHPCSETKPPWVADL